MKESEEGGARAAGFPPVPLFRCLLLSTFDLSPPLSSHVFSLSLLDYAHLQKRRSQMQLQCFPTSAETF